MGPDKFWPQDKCMSVMLVFLYFVYFNFSTPCQAISRIFIHKRLDYSHQTINIEARIGSTSLDPRKSGLQQILANTKCGATTGNLKVNTEQIKCNPPLDGQYLSLQNMGMGGMSIGELNIFSTGSWKMQSLHAFFSQYTTFSFFRK